MKGGSRKFKVGVLGIVLFSIYMKKRVILWKLESTSYLWVIEGLENECLALLLMNES